MSYIDYRYAKSQLGDPCSDELGRSLAATWRSDPPFYGIIMLAMWRADTDNSRKLRMAWPHVWAEMQERYNAPGGLLHSDPPGLRERVLAQARGEVRDGG